MNKFYRLGSQPVGIGIDVVVVQVCGLAVAGVFKRRTSAGHGTDIGVGGRLEARGDQDRPGFEL